ncbi:hypothetical protein AURDEDRAFT_57303 [Auricularia subglabra TFB-10046 SS5]|nr:hypothetical protein AURDEDRAFT_57303 [Auricularia subglabra TFB-10046 SS5]
MVYEWSTGVQFSEAQLHVAKFLRGKIVVGHQLWFDLAALNLRHLAIDTRDCALFLPFRGILGVQPAELSLPALIWHLMRRKITAGYQNSLEDARACIDLFRAYETQWESFIQSGRWPCALPPHEYQSFFS